MTLAIHKKDDKSHELSLIEQVVLQGDLSKLDPTQRVLYYNKVCESAGLNPYTRPFDYISLNGKLTLYAKKDATEQLRKLNGISIDKLESSVIDDLYIVKATASTRDGRTDQSTGAVVIGHLKGEQKANAIMKAETKAKRRVTLSISGMGWTDETEVESIPNARKVEVDLDTGEMVKEIAAPVREISDDEAESLRVLMLQCSDEKQQVIAEYLHKQIKVDSFNQLPRKQYELLKNRIEKIIQEEKITLKEGVEDE